MMKPSAKSRNPFRSSDAPTRKLPTMCFMYSQPVEPMNLQVSRSAAANNILVAYTHPGVSESSVNQRYIARDIAFKNPGRGLIG